MRGSLGEKINQGGTADIQWVPWSGRKTVRGTFPAAARPARDADDPGSFSAGVPAPGVFGEGTLDGRFGMVLGSPRRTDTTAGHAQRAVTFAQAGAVPASLGLSVHRMSPPP